VGPCVLTPSFGVFSDLHTTLFIWAKFFWSADSLGSLCPTRTRTTRLRSTSLSYSPAQVSPHWATFGSSVPSHYLSRKHWAYTDGRTHQPERRRHAKYSFNQELVSNSLPASSIYFHQKCWQGRKSEFLSPSLWAVQNRNEFRKPKVIFIQLKSHQFFYLCAGEVEKGFSLPSPQLGIRCCGESV